MDGIRIKRIFLDMNSSHMKISMISVNTHLMNKQIVILMEMEVIIIIKITCLKLKKLKKTRVKKVKKRRKRRKKDKTSRYRSNKMKHL
jgi:hypothetical protein